MSAQAMFARDPLMPPRLLVSVRDRDEAFSAARGGAELIDLKEPSEGALGGVFPETIRAVVQALRAAGHVQPVSATIGDLPVTSIGEVLRRIDVVAACGVDVVKVGIAPGAEAMPLLEAIARCGHAVVPVLLADQGHGDEPFDAARAAIAAAPPALVLDTADKHGGSLLECVPHALLCRVIAQAHAAGVPLGLAGALRIDQWPALIALGPDLAGFRSAVCSGDRRAALDPARLRALCEARARAGAAPPAGDIESPAADTMTAV